MEAMACGLPIITSNSCGGSEIICHNEHGFICDPLDIKALVDSMNKIPLRIFDTSLGDSARNCILKYSPERLVSQLNKLYQEVLTDL